MAETLAFGVKPVSVSAEAVLHPDWFRDEFKYGDRSGDPMTGLFLRRDME